jgi:hypothetical protein
MSENRQGSFESALKLLSPLLAVAVFFWGIYTYSDNARETAETRRIEATLPYLKKQLELYTEATKTTAIIATSSDSAATETATKRFKELYWGELALVERDAVASAMVSFREALDAKQGQDALRPLALNLTDACRAELAVSWGTDAWKR